MSSTVSWPSLALVPSLTISCSMSAKLIFSTPRSTGTTSPVGDETAMEMST